MNQYLVLFQRDKDNKDSAYSVPVSNYSQSILAHQYNPMNKHVAEIIQVGEYFNVYSKPIQLPKDTSFKIKELKRTTLSLANDVVVAPVTALNTLIPLVDNETNFQPPVLDTGDAFQTEFSDNTTHTNKTNKQTQQSADTTKDITASEAELFNQIEPDEFDVADSTVDSILVDSTYVKMKSQPYRVAFKPDFFSVKLDNSILFNKYQPIGQSVSQNLGGMLSVSLNDALENHRFTAGYRLPLSLAGSAFFLQYENFTRRNDWGILYLRTTSTHTFTVPITDSLNRNIDLQATGKIISNLLQFSFSHPFDRRRSLRLITAFRLDHFNMKARGFYSLHYPPEDPVPNVYWNMTRAEYVYDNTKSPAINIWYGLRWKFYGEYFYKLSQNNGGFFNVGTDIRYYHKIYKTVIAASRLAYAHSMGDMQVNYMMGGVDNWLFGTVSSTPPPAGQNIAFQTLATNLRGYELNALNGNAYGVINAELRIPLVTPFAHRPIQNSFWKNLQLVPFLDFGSAWNGWLPQMKTQLDYYTLVNTDNTVMVKIEGNNFGAAMGFGSGLRTMLLGYFMRLDAAWNIDGRVKPIWYFSIGTDF
jgi:hypothetical protein